MSGDRMDLYGDLTPSMLLKTFPVTVDSCVTTVIDLVSVDLSPIFPIVLPCMPGDLEVTLVSSLASCTTPLERN